MIDKLIKLSPVPVSFTDTVIPGYDAMYWHEGIFSGKAHIEINSNLTEAQKIASLLHETAHAICVVKNCKCMKNPDKTEREIHAYISELRELLKHKQTEGLKDTITKLKYAAKGNNYYAKAAKQIMKLKLWKKCLKFIK